MGRARLNPVVEFSHHSQKSDQSTPNHLRPTTLFKPYAPSTGRLGKSARPNGRFELFGRFGRFNWNNLAC